MQRRGRPRRARRGSSTARGPRTASDGPSPSGGGSRAAPSSRRVERAAGQRGCAGAGQGRDRTIAEVLSRPRPHAESVAGRNPYSRPWQLPAVVVLCLVPVGIVVAAALANPPSTYTGCPAGDPTPIYVLDVTERTSTDLIVLVNATTNEFVPLSVFSAVLSR